MKRNPITHRINPGTDGLKVLSAAPASEITGVRQGEPLPRRMRVLKWGDSRTVDGDTMRVNAQSAALLPETQRDMNWPHAHIDIEHATIPGTPLFKLAAQSGRFPAVLGWGTPRVIEGEGLFVDDITWSPQSRRAYEFPDVSGVVKTLADGTVVGLHSFAFCCHGKAEGATAFSALLTDPQTEDEEDALMDKLLMALLGLKETDDEAAKLERASKLGAALQAMAGAEPKALSALLALEPAKLAALGALDAGKLKELSALSAKDLEAKIKLLSSMDEGQGAAVTVLGKRIGDVETSLKALSQDNTAMRRAKILGDAAAKGKAVPEAWLTKYGNDLTVLSDMIDGLPEGVVPLSQQADAGGGKRQVTAACGAEADVAKVFGRKPEDLKGY